MGSTRKRLAELTADLRLPEDVPPAKERVAPSVGPDDLPPAAGEGVETRFPQARSGPLPPRTGPGQMLAFRGQMREVEGELNSLREKLSQFQDAMPSRRLDPAKIRPSRWANRHDSSFGTVEFASLKDEIAQAGGNVQPILVRRLEGVEGEYEVVFGHRRLRACLELGIPVLAMIWEGELPDLELFAAMERENREREDLSPYEQGRSYQRALDEGLFPTQRRLAEFLGVSHTWVRKALMVAALPPAVVECFRTPLEISHRHAEKLAAVLDTDRRAVLKRADKLRGLGGPANQVVERLLGGVNTAASDARLVLRAGTEKLGNVKRKANGTIQFDVLPAALTQESREVLLAAIGQLLDDMSNPPLQEDASDT